jgi:isopenicillin N synthase-like dioxygenase
MSTPNLGAFCGAVNEISVIDVAPLLEPRATRQELLSLALRFRRACRESGFFYVVGHGIDETLVRDLERLSRAFFARPLQEKLRIRMALGGRAWRGYFPVGDELTSGHPDQKEGIYFGAELASDHPNVAAGLPLHGRNLYPDGIPGFDRAVHAYMRAMTDLGQLLLRGVAMSLDLDPGYFLDRYTREPLVLFRIFHYPPIPASDASSWSVGEHTDYGLLTILRQDDCGGLEVKSPSGWVEARPIEGSFVCNLGDMLDRMTGGYYRSTAHRVRNVSGRERVSFPFFLDPGWDVAVSAIRPGASLLDDADERWDRASVHAFHGTYGDYLLGKVSKVFPALKREVL